jgi:hypothetical protein
MLIKYRMEITRGWEKWRKGVGGRLDNRCEITGVVSSRVLQHSKMTRDHNNLL